MGPPRYAKLTDRVRIEAFLRRDAASHVYALADLDDFFWSQTEWHAALDGEGEIRALCLQLGTFGQPVVYAVCTEGDPATADLLRQRCDALPDSFFANLGLGLLPTLTPAFAFRTAGEHVKMILDGAVPAVESTAPLVPLGYGDLGELERFYAEAAYTDSESHDRFFEPYMLENGPYMGVRVDGRLVAAGGVHVHSRRYRVAALGNIATTPEHRRRGHARAITAALCHALAPQVELIGLNVEADNHAAARCYLALGFKPVRRYVEGTFSRVSAAL